ncbi:capsular exopolysaccharide synthesis family protein [Paenibacillus forsythiae]|uniref:Capsular exopolysaccharide synthesis family protein n=1 Tax=Paenibacillus forsythiae TaxID=365616 RepID=A0ABU3H8I5_9BACL|nr:CpsD/CapB family tyrosine-protein kinase [Paenibacillus forsythiae]MDT3427135.1 capsular exopolysaccharide synthesis family protein [Paenibacillus forsythiae]
MLRLSNTLIAERNPQSHVSESFRSLRTYIRQLGLLQGGGKALLFTSGGAGEGKTTVLANLAVSFVQDGKKVAVVDGNLRGPGLHTVFGLENGAGLADYLSGLKEADQISVYGNLANLTIVTAGVSTASPPDLLGNAKMGELLEELKGTHDLVLLDTPPAVEYSDARVLAPLTDGVVIVARYGKSKRDSIRKVKTLMEQSGTAILGIAINQAK